MQDMFLSINIFDDFLILTAKREYPKSIFIQHDKIAIRSDQKATRWTFPKLIRLMPKNQQFIIFSRDIHTNEIMNIQVLYLKTNDKLMQTFC